VLRRHHWGWIIADVDDRGQSGWSLDFGHPQAGGLTGVGQVLADSGVLPAHHAALRASQPRGGLLYDSRMPNYDGTKRQTYPACTRHQQPASLNIRLPSYISQRPYYFTCTLHIRHPLLQDHHHSRRLGEASEGLILRIHSAFTWNAQGGARTIVRNIHCTSKRKRLSHFSFVHNILLSFRSVLDGGVG
jgi:hypothetical protein